MTVEEKVRSFARIARLNEVTMKTTATTTVNLLQKVRRSTASEHRLAGAAKCRTDFRAFARLQENGADHQEAGEDVDDDDECVHKLD